MQGALAGGVTSLVFMAWICIRAQSLIRSGDITFPEKPVSTEDCHYHFTPRMMSNLRQAVNLTEIIHTEWEWYFIGLYSSLKLNEKLYQPTIILFKLKLNLTSGVFKIIQIFVVFNEHQEHIWNDPEFIL